MVSISTKVPDGKLLLPIANRDTAGLLHFRADDRIAILLSIFDKPI